jgi:hypothetical protein
LQDEAVALVKSIREIAASNDIEIKSVIGVLQSEAGKVPGARIPLDASLYQNLLV